MESEVSTMFTLRCTQRLLRRLKVPGQVADRPPSTRLGDWYANLLRVGSRQLILATSERSLLTVYVAAKQPATLPDRLRLAVAQLLEQLGMPAYMIATEIAEMTNINIGRTQDRRVLGTMNDLAFQARWRLQDEPIADLSRLQLELATMPCGTIDYLCSGAKTAELFGLNWSHRASTFL